MLSEKEADASTKGTDFTNNLYKPTVSHVGSIVKREW